MMEALIKVGCPWGNESAMCCVERGNVQGLQLLGATDIGRIDVDECLRRSQDYEWYHTFDRVKWLHLRKLELEFGTAGPDNVYVSVCALKTLMFRYQNGEL